MSPGSNSFTPLNTYLVRHTVAGVKVHDARLIASMKGYGITHLLTFNTEDFTRYPDITVVAPQYVPQT
jgi:predicted nucleic acid-binding protein